jgi:iron complex outermembrane receptor protein
MMRPLRMVLGLAVLTPAALPAAAQTVDYSALAGVMGEPVTTSVTGRPQRASELPASTVIITAEQIARSPAHDVPGLLKGYAGIDVNRWTAGQSDVAVRGGVQSYNARLLVLVDGRQVYLDHYGMTDWNLLGVPIEDIQQIELVRGPASALFGFNAASGVVNIITKKPHDTLAATAVAAIGDHDRSRLAGSLMVPIAADVGIKLTGQHMREDERRVPDTLLPPGRIRDVAASHVASELYARVGPLTAAIGGGYATNEQMEYLPSQILSNQNYRSGNLHATVSRDTGWGGLTFNGFVNWLDATYGVDAVKDQPKATLDIGNRIVSLKAAGLYRFGENNVFRLGSEYRNNRITGEAQFADKISYDVASIDGMLDLHFGDRVALSTAARFDRLWLKASGAVAEPTFNDPRDFDRAFSRVSLNAALLVQVGTSGRLRVNGGRGYQLPSLTTLGVRIPLVTATPLPFPVFVAGTPALDPVRTWSGEIGYEHALGSTRLEMTGFYTRTDKAIASPGDGLQDLLEFHFVPGPVAVARFQVAGDYDTYGVELSASGTRGAVVWRTNYTWTHTDEQVGSLAAPIALAFSPRSTTPRHKANFELGYDAGARWYTSMLARYTSPTRQFAFTTGQQLGLFRVSDALGIDARLGYRFSPHVAAYVAAENLTLAGGIAGSPIPADRRIRAGLRLSI